MNQTFILVLTAALSLTFHSSLANESAKLQIDSPKSLSVGDTLPDLLVNRLNQADPNAKLSDDGGKAIVLDFWNIWCSSCIKAMPEMAALQREFPKIQVFLITSNTKAQVEKLKTHNQIVKNVTLPFVTDDTVFSKYFPMVTYPTHVWIDSNHVIRQITNGYNTTASSIQSWLNGRSPSLVIKKEQTDFDLSAPLWGEGNGRQRDRIKFYSLITSKIDYRLQTGYSKTDSLTGKLVWLHLINYSIYNLYRNAFCMQYNIPLLHFNKRCILLSKQVEKIREPIDLSSEDEWSQKNTWCYEILVPVEKSAQLTEVMLQDLDRYFNLKSRCVNINRKCIVVRTISSPNVKRPNTENPEQIQKHHSTDIIIRNQSIRKTLLPELQYLLPDKFLVDETGPDSRATIILPAAKNNLPVLKRTLRQYGLDLIERTRTITFLQIMDQ